ncbi:nicotinate phosphoribosyltransferase [Candidatus Micrarchaeota archaeon]|nr:MAG: nicotinate phosphoribosyltransferase [Candidatus Micrarchaeota archaeon]
MYSSISNQTAPLLTDLYQLTMCASYFDNGHRGEATFDLFVRSMPPHRSYLLFAGLESALDYLKNLKFTDECINYLDSTKLFKDSFLSYLERFKFRGDVHAIAEGTLFFPNEPVMRVTAPLPQAQLVETFLLNTVNFQTLVASKAARIATSARNASLVDFSPRRDHGAEAALQVARSSYIAGFTGTSNVLAGKKYGIPIYGTVAHSFIMSYEYELDAFRAYSSTFPDKCLLLIDTYDTLKGARNAVKIGEELKKNGHSLMGVRLDSGNLLKLSRKVRELLDKSGFKKSIILASGNLDEYKIEKLVKKKAPIDSFGVGTALGTSNDAPFLNVNYKLSEFKGKPVIKLSSGKMTLPGRKQVYRFYDGRGKMKHDLIGLESEKSSGRALLKQVMKNGRLARKHPPLNSIRKNARRNLESLPGRCKRLKQASTYEVRLSKELQSIISKLKQER